MSHSRYQAAKKVTPEEAFAAIQRRANLSGGITSMGQYILRLYMEAGGCPQFVENYRPPWLMGMELDFWFPSLNLAIEFDGDQHFIWSKFGDCSQQRQRDFAKRSICKRNGVTIQRLQAIDLQYSIIARKLVKLGVVQRGCYNHSAEARVLNKAAVEYRRRLKESFPTVTCLQRKNKARKLVKIAASAAYNPNHDEAAMIAAMEARAARRLEKKRLWKEAKRAAKAAALAVNLDGG